MSGIAASSLIVLAPCLRGSEERLQAALAALGAHELSPFAALGGTHFARWVFIEALPGPGDQPVDSDQAFLLLCADFDGTPLTWSEALCARAGETLGPVMACWEGFPGLANAEAVRDFLLDHNAAAGFTVAGYRRATVEEVVGALRLRRELRQLAMRAQRGSLDPDTLFEQWRAASR